MLGLASFCAAGAVLTSFSKGYLPLWAFLFVTQALGLYVGLQLFLSLLGQNNRLVKKICQYGRRNECTEVITSSRFNIFGMSLTEVVAVYFSSNLVATIISGFSSWQTLNAVLYCSLLAVPFTLYTIMHQLYFSKWCRLCLAITLLIWMQTATAYIFGDFRSLFVDSNYLVLPLCIATTFAFWLSIREVVLKGTKFHALEKRITSFSKNKKIFAAWLRHAGLKLTQRNQGIIIGGNAGTYSLTIVTNPLCSPCAEAHDRLKKVSETITTEVIFLTGPPADDNLRYQVALHLIALSLEDRGLFENAMTGWYSNQDERRFQDWVQSHPVNKDSLKSAKNVLQEHNRICYDLRIDSTPSFFLDGKLIPSEYTLDELIYHLRSMAIIVENEKP